MKIIVGLGNPGDKYKDTRHNIGFDVLDKLQYFWKFPSFKHEQKFKGEITSGQYNNEKVILLKPTTYMNLSGESLQSLSSFYKVHTTDIIIIYDDIDLPLGKLRIRKDGSAGGHNGVKSIIKHLGTQSIQRVRLGIENRSDKRFETSNYVLAKWKKAEQPLVEDIVVKGMDAIESIIQNGVDSAMNTMNQAN